MELYKHQALVIGTGAAGYSAAVRLKQFGVDVAIVTEGVDCGTSRNTGSDKQTFYKLGLGGDAPDSVRKMAEDLFCGGSVDGDNALCEAALSTRCFMQLCEAGVAFPHNRYGEYVGYKTDHDPYARATSAGPLTSKYMTEALQKRAAALDIPVYDGLLAVQILQTAGRVCGLICIRTADGAPVAFGCADLVMATGGPAGIYADSVYPVGHTGSTGLALAAGAAAQNLTEWQFGLASLQPRWNVSGSYMQVLPRFVSVDENGETHEFLADYFSDPYQAMSAVFLKGYQWPFDTAKVLEGSSVIDLLVYRECVLRHRRVFLDYRENPFGLQQIDFARLAPEAFKYLSKAGVCFGTPIQRLLTMNAPAVALYEGKGVDLTAAPLEIALCAQHNNGGLAVDMWWRTSVPGLFAVGECAGTHGVTRPGGSALNAGQVGALRAAQYIAAHPGAPVADGTLQHLCDAAAAGLLQERTAVLGELDTVQPMLQAARRRMSDAAGAIRDKTAMAAALKVVQSQLRDLCHTARVTQPAQLVCYYKLRDTLLTQAAVLTAMLDFAAAADGSRGSALYCDEAGVCRAGLEPLFRFVPETGATRAMVQQVVKTADGFTADWRPVRPLPDTADFFETVWRRYRENGNIY